MRSFPIMRSSPAMHSSLATHSSLKTLLPGPEETQRAGIRGAVEDDPLVDEEAYYEMIRSACEDVVLDLMVQCSWSTLRAEALHEILEDYYNHRVEDKIHEHGVVGPAWKTGAPGTPEERRQAIFDVARRTIDEIGSRSDVIIRRAKTLFLQGAGHIKIRVRGDGIEVVDLYQDDSNAGRQNRLDKKLDKKLGEKLSEKRNKKLGDDARS